MEFRFFRGIAVVRRSCSKSVHACPFGVGFFAQSHGHERFVKKKKKKISGTFRFVFSFSWHRVQFNRCSGRSDCFLFNNKNVTYVFTYIFAPPSRFFRLCPAVRRRRCCFCPLAFNRDHFSRIARRSRWISIGPSLPNRRRRYSCAAPLRGGLVSSPGSICRYIHTHPNLTSKLRRVTKRLGGEPRAPFVDGLTQLGLFRVSANSQLYHVYQLYSSTITGIWHESKTNHNPRLPVGIIIFILWTDMSWCSVRHNFKNRPLLE